MRKKNVLIACTGSVASIKIPDIVQQLELHKEQVDVKVVATDNALKFFSVALLDVKVLTEEDEWSTWKIRGDPVLHIELKKWADLMVICPLDANTLAKIAAGICDNLLTCILRAWDVDKPVLFAPAMNTFMWKHPFTAKHISTLRELGYKEIPCIEKTLMCGDIGFGAMAEVTTIVDAILDVLGLCKDQQKSKQ